MTETERVLLELVEQHLRVWRCHSCGGRWLTGRSERALFHACEPGRTVDLRARRVDLGDGWPDTREEARTQMYESFAGGLPEDALLRPIETD